MQKQDTANPKQKNTTRKQKYKSQNRNKHLKAETLQNNTKLNHKTEREFKNTNHDQKPQPSFLFFSFHLFIVFSSPFVCCKLVLGILM